MNVRISVIKTLSSLILSLLILSAFTIMYRHTSLHIENMEGTTNYRAEPNFYSVNMQEGFSVVKFDSDGFNNSSVEKNPDILVMGSSHMEAIQVLSKDNCSSVLNELLPSKSVYNIGMSGHTIYDCISNINKANYFYNPNDYIVIETDRIELEIDKMQSVMNGGYYTGDVDKGLKYYMKKGLPVLKNFWIQVSEWKNIEKTSYIFTDNSFDYNSKAYLEIVDEFLKNAVNSVGDNVKVIIVYHPETRINEKGDFIDNTNKDALKTFKKVCDSNGIIFVDMTDDFKQLYNDKHILPHGFTNTAVGVGHLNKYGHDIIAKKLAEVIGGVETNVIE